jgi:hypothetical protein
MNVVADGRDRDQLGQSVKHYIPLTLDINIIVTRHVRCVYIPDLTSAQYHNETYLDIRIVTSGNQIPFARIARYDYRASHYPRMSLE